MHERCLCEFFRALLLVGFALTSLDQPRDNGRRRFCIFTKPRVAQVRPSERVHAIDEETVTVDGNSRSDEEIGRFEQPASHRFES